MDLQTIIGQLFSLDPSRAPATIHGGRIPQGPAPKAPAAKDPVIDDSPAGKVLATLNQRNTPKAARGPMGIPTGPLPDVKGKSMGSAFATGLAAGMNNAQNASRDDNKSAEATAANNLKTMAALFTAQQQEKANEIREQNAKSLREYYQGIVANGAKRAAATGGGDPIKNEHTLEMTRRSAAMRFGLNDPVTAKDMASPIPSIRDAATKRYEQRKKAYDEWEASFNARVGKGEGVVDAAVDAHQRTGTDGAPDAGGGPATPPVDPKTGKPAPAPAGAAKPAPAAAAPQPETWQPIRNTKDGSMWLFNPATGEKKPMGDPAAKSAPAAGPGPSYPAPPSFDGGGGGDDPAAIMPDDEEGDE